MKDIWVTLTATGGLLRVRALLTVGMTLVGGMYLLAYQEMPPPAYTAIWGPTVAFYFITRAKGD